MADDARAKRAAALEEKKKRLEALKARRAERAAAAASGGASATAASSASTATPSRGAGGNLDEYIDGLLKSDAPAVPGVEPPKPAAAAGPVSAETSTSATTDAADGEPSPKDTESGDGKERTSTGATPAIAPAAPAPAPAPVRKVETFTMATQTEEDDFPPALDDEDDDVETKRKQQAEAATAAAATASAGEGDGEDNDSEKGTQTMPIAQLDPNSLTETISSRPFQHFLNSASKKVEKVLGAGALAELLDDPAYDDEMDEDEDDQDLADNGAISEDDGAGMASEGEDGGTTHKRAKKGKKRAGRLGLLGGKTSADGALDATGIIKSSQTYSCPRWTANRDLTSITWSPHKREMLVASYQSSSSAGGVDAAVRAVSPADTPSSSLIPQSSELRSDGLALLWNLAMPDRPEHIFCCGSPVLTTAFHPTETRLVIGGCHSGQVVVWDVRAGRLPVQRSVGPAGGGHAHPICSMEVVESGVSHVACSL